MKWILSYFASEPMELELKGISTAANVRYHFHTCDHWIMSLMILTLPPPLRLVFLESAPDLKTLDLPCLAMLT